MNAAVFNGPRKIDIRQVPVPAFGPVEIRIRLYGCGLCASNLPVWEGRPWFTYPLEPGAPGHEAWGIVDAVGDRVQGFRPGDRVAFLSSHAYAEYDIAREDAVAVLPPALAEKPFPGEPLACAMNIFARSDIQPDHTVAIVGLGFLGALLTSLTSRAGARVVAVSRRPSALGIAASQGACKTIPLLDRNQVVEEINSFTSNEGCDRVIEAAGLQETLDIAAECTRIRGRLIIAGYHQDGLRNVNMQLWNWRGIDVVNAHERDPKQYLLGMQAAIEAMADGAIDPFPLFTHRFPLDRLNDAFTVMRDRPPEFMKALIVYE